MSEAWKVTNIDDAKLSIFGGNVSGNEQLVEKYGGLPSLRFHCYANAQGAEAR